MLLRLRACSWSTANGRSKLNERLQLQHGEPEALRSLRLAIHFLQSAECGLSEMFTSLHRGEGQGARGKAHRIEASG